MFQFSNRPSSEFWEDLKNININGKNIDNIMRFSYVKTDARDGYFVKFTKLNLRFLYVL